MVLSYSLYCVYWLLPTFTGKCINVQAFLKQKCSSTPMCTLLNAVLKNAMCAKMDDSQIKCYGCTSLFFTVMFDFYYTSWSIVPVQGCKGSVWLYTEENIILHYLALRTAKNIMYEQTTSLSYESPPLHYMCFFTALYTVKISSVFKSL